MPAFIEPITSEKETVIRKMLMFINTLFDLRIDVFILLNLRYYLMICWSIMYIVYTRRVCFFRINLMYVCFIYVFT